MDLTDYYRKLTKYFRCSVLDGERLSPDTKTLLQAVKSHEFSKIEKDQPFAVSSSAWENGQLGIDTASTIFSILKVSQEVQEVNIVLMPRVDLLNVSVGETIGRQSRIITPLIVQARLSRSGDLSASASPPFVPREWLAPNQTDQIPFGHVDVLDEFITQNPYSVESWQELKHYCCRMISCLLDGSLDANENSISQSIYEFSILDDYQVKQDICLLSLDPAIKAGFHILKIYDAIIRGLELNKLYKKAFSMKKSEVVSYQDLTYSNEGCLSHKGQMTAEFPLADKQRNALHYISRMETGDLLAVNGPPGTGKTTLLRSVVADAWVNAALKGNEPPIIVAASSSNQAVTNILDSFCRIKETHVEEALTGRWLPEINSYGLYARGDNCPKGFEGYSFLTKKGAGTMRSIENDIPLVELIEFFLEYFNAWNRGEKISLIESAISVLHEELIKCANLQEGLQERFINYQQIIKDCNLSYGSEAGLANFIHQKSIEKQNRADLLKENESHFDLFLELWQQRSFLESLFSFLPMIKKRWMLANEMLARKCNIEIIGTSDEEVRSTIEGKSLEIRSSLAQTCRELENAKAVENKLTGEKEKFIHLLELANVDLGGDYLNFPKLIAEIDTKLRFRCFKLATHYWEARWLKDMDVTIEHPRTPDERLNTYRRYAKLAPCFVSTFNMLPNFFEVSGEDGDGWKSTPFVDGADLLIVDEAGQALPHIAGASFLLAKKAVLVGDIYQIEPVWSISKGVDIANLDLHELINEQLDYRNFWLNSEMLASSGNLMKVAHRQAYCQQFDDLERGLYLTEHRRCFDSIIDYCNKLVYQGHLEPMRGESEEKMPMPTMGFIHHESVSQRVGVSRTNATEAKFICQWILNSKHKLTNQKPIEEVVAIITPFAMQAKTIKRELSKVGLSKIKVGTVHTFQGAECDVVLFSSVYASNDSAGSKFYDRGSNMMNVAVSRAKNSFIVVGDKNIFGVGDKSSPSGLLSKYLSGVKGI
ncbi:MAG: hypothetical protein D6B27_10210 [Gammaproteobacteria bacterium]|nr:MAG: hypothetical protein D6B27_10210 [Gammaproteobacteria bacterium]